MGNLNRGLQKLRLGRLPRHVDTYEEQGLGHLPRHVDSYGNWIKDYRKQRLGNLPSPGALFFSLVPVPF